MPDQRDNLDILRTRLLRIELPVTRLAKQCFNVMMQHSLERHEGQILVIAGMPGTGKTHLKDQLVRLAEALCSEAKSQIPVLVVGLETALTLGDLAQQIAMVIGNPVTMHKIMNKTTKQLSTEVFEDIKKLGVKVIFFDEAHYISLASNPAATQSVMMASWLKKLTNHGISIVLLGLPELRDKLSPYKELVSRMYRSQPIMTTGLTASTAAERASALDFLNEVQRAYGIDAEVDFSHPSIVIPMTGAMGGNLRDIMRLIGSAINHSRMLGEARVSLRSFEAAADLCGFPWRA